MNEYTLEDLQEELRSIEEELKHIFLTRNRYLDEISQMEDMIHELQPEANALRIAIERFEK